MENCCILRRSFGADEPNPRVTGTKGLLKPLKQVWG
jgi:hypothetical protein